MNEFTPFIVAGLVQGAVYGMSGVGLVLTYRTSGVFNFAYGVVGSLAAFSFWYMTEEWSVPWPWALAACVVVIGLLASVVVEAVCHGLAQARPAMKIVGMIGLLLLLQGLIGLVFGSGFETLLPFLPTNTFTFADTFVGYDQLIIVVTSLVLVVVLYAFLQLSRVGATMRGVVDDAELVALTGRNPELVRWLASLIGMMLAALSGILLAPAVGLDAVLLTLLVVQAFGAAAVGRFKSLPLSYIGGLLIGVAAALSTKYSAEIPELGGLPASLPFVVLFVVLLVTPKRALIEVATDVAARARGARARPRWFPKPVGPAIWAALLLLVPAFAGSSVPLLGEVGLPLFTNGVILIIVYLSLDLLVRTSGQISLCQIAFVAVGASTFAHLTTDLGLPWLVALVAAGLVVVPIGVFLALPAIRLSGLYLALATLGFGIALEQIFYTMSFMFGVSSLSAPRPELFGIDLGTETAFYYVTLAVAGVAIGLVALIRASRMGRLLRAMADSPVALNHLGLSVNRPKVIVFAVAALLGGVAGGLQASLLGQVNGESFPFITSIYWLAVIGIVARFGRYAALVGGITGVLPTYLDRWLSIDFFGRVEVQFFLFGLAAMAHALVSARPPRARRHPDEPEPVGAEREAVAATAVGTT
jgi:branched-subunit amino acid ABC-type transport system permease component